MRYVQIVSRFLTQPYGAIVSQDRLGMTDDKLDEFIAAGYAIEAEIDYVPGRRTGERIVIAVEPAVEEAAPPADKPKRGRRSKG